MLVVLAAVALFIGIGALSRRVSWPQTLMVIATAIVLGVIQLTLPRFL